MYSTEGTSLTRLKQRNASDGKDRKEGMKRRMMGKRRIQGAALLSVMQFAIVIQPMLQRPGLK